MFKRSRRKIVAAIMSILVLLWVGTLGIIYVSSYFEMSNQNKEMLKTHSNMFVLSQTMDNPNFAKPRPTTDNRDFDPAFANSPKFQLSTFYTVAVSYSGEILETKNEQPTVYSDEDLETLACRIIENEDETGEKNNLLFYKTDKGGYMLVTFMDNTIINENAVTLFRYTLIFGGIAIILFFFFSVFIARKIVRPLEESYQKQKQFISDAGHELKTPVSIVSANAELLSRELGDNQWLSNIQYENERMGILITQLLELARTENITPQTEKLDFSRLVGGEALPFESVAYEKGLILNCEINNNLFINGNSEQLKQLVSILLDNAIRHSTDGKEINLILKEERNSVKLSVINFGKEIPQEQKSQLFERFYRIDTVRNSEEKHYGLGLSIANAIVSLHHGKIEVLCYDQKVEFTVLIPSVK